jgi:hypothetical protein
LPAETAGSSIVLVGSFNPAIFQPSWFARQNLITTAEAEASDVKIIHPEICHFETEAFVVHVTKQRFMASTKPNTHWVLLRDLVLGTFYILEHTPVTALGMNRQMHFRVADEAAWHRLGDRLAPKEAWNEVLGGRPGLLTVEILADRRNVDEHEAAPAEAVKIRVKVQPSVRVTPYGAFFETNEHYPAPEADGLRSLLATLQERWEGSQEYANYIADHILDWASREPEH